MRSTLHLKNIDQHCSHMETVLKGYSDLYIVADSESIIETNGANLLASVELKLLYSTERSFYHTGVGSSRD